MKPIRDIVIVKADKSKSNKSTSTFALPEKDMSEMMYQPGTVQSVGEEVHQVKSGDRVLYNQHSTWKQRINGDIYLVMPISSIGIILEEGDDIY